MLFRQLFDKESSTYTYLIAEDKGCDAVIIDPVKSNVDQYIKIINELNLNRRFNSEVQQWNQDLAQQRRPQRVFCIVALFWGGYSSDFQWPEFHHQTPL